MCIRDRVYANDVSCAKSIAMPAISSGLFGVPMDIVSAAIAYAIQSFDCYLTTLTLDRQNLGHIKFVNIDRQTTEQLIDKVKTLLALELISERADTHGADLAEYTDVRNYVTNCETCKIAKADNHPVKTKIRCREVPPPEFFSGSALFT